MYIYLGTFLISLATLAYEVALTRVLSGMMLPQLGFFAVAAALLGITIGGILVYRSPQRFDGELRDASVGTACLAFAALLPFTLLVLCLDPVTVSITAAGILSLMLITAAATLPFIFSGAAVAAVLTRVPLPIGRLYAADLAGASVGCLAVLAWMERFDGPSVILLCGLVAAAAALLFLKKRLVAVIVLAILALLFFVNAFTPFNLRCPVTYRGQRWAPGQVLLEKWNSFSRIDVAQPAEQPPQYWGASPRAPQENILQYNVAVDGRQSSVLRRYFSRGDIAHLRYDLTSIVYYLRPKGDTCIIGIGAGKDVQSAIAFGHDRITGIDVNPLFLWLVEGPFRDFAGIAGHPGIDLVAADARSYLSRYDDRYAVIQMALVSHRPAAGSAAFSFLGNTLYTLEAWNIFFDRLAPDGIFSVSRWYTPGMATLAVATLLDSGVANPAEHIMMLTAPNDLCTLLISRRPFTPEETARMRTVASRLQFSLAAAPGAPPKDALLNDILAARSDAELRRVIRHSAVDCRVATDERPYVYYPPRKGEGAILPWLAGADRIAYSVFFFAFALVILALELGVGLKKIHGEMRRLSLAAAGYFALIGAGYMFVEIALIQKLSVVLGNPVYALALLLCVLIASTGAGSLLSERLPLMRPHWRRAYPVAAALAVLAVRFLLPPVAAHLAAAPLAAKMAASAALIIPVGLLLGLCFPAGMRLIHYRDSRETPWYWALNGVAGTVSSVLTLFVSFQFGISMNLVVGALCYALLLLPIAAVAGGDKPPAI